MRLLRSAIVRLVTRLARSASILPPPLWRLRNSVGAIASADHAAQTLYQLDGGVGTEPILPEHEE